MNYLNKEEIVTIKACGKVLAESILEAANAVKPGASTFEIDTIAEQAILSRGCKPSFKNYLVAGAGHFPAALCISINDEIVHGIPSKQRIIKDGDIVSLDLGAEMNGIYTDMALTIAVGKVSEDAQELINVTKASLEMGIDQARVGNTIGDIGASIEQYAEGERMGVIREYVGHGIGRKPHMEPQIPNFGRAATGEEIKEGMALAIEPMLTLGDYHTKVLGDRWTVKTADGSLSAHFEHTVVIENGKPVIVTKA